MRVWKRPTRSSKPDTLLVEAVLDGGRVRPSEGSYLLHVHAALVHFNPSGNFRIIPLAHRQR